MIDGMAVTDAHVHVPRLSTVSPAWMQWAADFGQDSGWQTVFGPDGDPVPARLDALLEAEGVDIALLFAEDAAVVMVPFGGFGHIAFQALNLKASCSFAVSFA